MTTSIIQKGQRKNLDKNILNIAYSGFNLDSLHDNGLPYRNSIEHFDKCLQYGFNALKCDMQLTSDGKIFLCHDICVAINNGVISEDGNVIEGHTPISSFTLAELLACEYPDGTHPCDLQTFLVICKKYDMVPFITLRDQSDADDVVEELNKLLELHGLKDVAIINLYIFGSFNNWALSMLDYPLRKCYTLDNPNTELTTAQIDTAIAYGCEFICCYENPMIQASDAVMEYAGSNGVRVLGQCYTHTEWENAINKGFVGFQVYDIDAINGVETVNSLAYKILNQV